MCMAQVRWWFKVDVGICPQLPESSEPRLTSWVARALLSGYFVAITKQHFFWEANFQDKFPESSKGRVSFSLKSSEVSEDTSTISYRIHWYITDMVVFRDLLDTYMLVGFSGGETVGSSGTRQVDRWHRGWHVSLGWTSGQLSYRSGTLASGCQSHGLSIRSLVEQPWNLKKTLQETTKMAIAGKSPFFSTKRLHLTNDWNFPLSC